jgi:hypothetical protein
MSGPPAWLTEFADRVCACLLAIDEMPPIGCHYVRDQGIWEVTLFISPTEIVGGQYDGERYSCLFAVDALELLHLFDVVESVTWQAQQVPEGDELGSHLAFAGCVQGRLVTLRVLSETPQRFSPGRFANLHEQKFLETWRE